VFISIGLLRGQQLSHYHAKVRTGLKPSLKTLLIILAVFSFAPAAAAQQKADASAMPFTPQAYRVGERLTYDVSFAQFVSAAHIELSVAARGQFFAREGIQLRAHAETTGVVNVALFAVNNDYTTYVDPDSGLPYRAQQVVHQAGRTTDDSSDYNQPAGADAIPAKLRTGEFPGTYDLLSALYRLRAMPLADGSSYKFSVRQDGVTYETEIKVSGHELVKTKVGSFNAIVTEVNVKNSQLGGYRIRVFFSDDERHIPVLLTAKLSAGQVRAELAGSEIITPGKPIAQPTPPVVVPPPTAVNIRATSPDNLRPPLPFKVGEQLNYRVYMPGVTQPVGTALFEVRSRARYFDRDGLFVSARAETLPEGARIFVVNDQINSYLDPTSLLPFRTEIAFSEGNRKTNRTYIVDQDRGNATTEGRRIDIPVGTHDLISLVYAARTFEATPGRRNAISVLVNDRTLTLFITCLPRETIELGGQKIQAVRVSLTTDDPEGDKYQLRVWVSDDARRLPLRFTAVTPLGLLRAELAIIPPLTSK